MLNPAEIKHQRSIAYNKESRFGSLARTPRFNTMDNDTLTLAIVLDGTGAVPWLGPSAPKVLDQVRKLEHAIYRYDRNDGEPPVVRIVWGSVFFGGRLQSMSTRFTLFEPSGEPLRAMIDLSFIGSMDLKEVKAILEAAARTQDKQIEVREGDTLLQLCAETYGDYVRYLEIARLNGLQSFRNVLPGTKLRLPADQSPGS
jgi:nucleoid-associated protein YgaU